MCATKKDGKRLEDEGNVKSAKAPRNKTPE
jgi:hypothetical protein